MFLKTTFLMLGALHLALAGRGAEHGDFCEHHSDSNTNQGNNKGNKNAGRSKRAYQNKPWPEDWIPYVFGSDLSVLDKHKYRGMMQTIEENSCVRFFDKVTNSSDHMTVTNTPGWVYIYDGGSCSVSGLGYGANGRRMSPCSQEYQYIHEYGHLSALDHIIEFHERNEHLFMMLDNAGDYYRPIQELENNQDNVESCGFSAQSPMLSDKYAISKYNWPTYNSLYPNLLEIKTNNLFTYFKELNLVQGCGGETSCVSSTCDNEGFLIDTDVCLCPRGFNPDTNCTTVMVNRPEYQWPSAVTLVAPVGGCPDTFEEGTLMSQSEGDNLFSSPNTLRGTQTADAVQTDFCTKTDGNYGGSWGAGDYCFLTQESFNCATNGFKVATWQVQEATYSGTKLTNSSAFPYGNFQTTSSYYTFCCRNDGIEYNHLKLPNDKAFFLYKALNHPCQKVEAMSVSNEYVTFDQPSPSTNLFGESRPDFVEDGATNKLTMSYCRYEPLDYNCGGIYTLNSANPSVTIQSPNYPSDFGTNKHCNWAFKAPERSSIVLACDYIGDLCEASLEIRKKDFSEAAIPVIVNDGHRMPPVLSLFNKIVLTFENGQTSCTNSGGFQCTATLGSGEDLPYPHDSRGEMYAGNLNYAVNEYGFHECLQWADVFENVPDVYVSPRYPTTNHHADYESNYCRNVDGDRLKPFCATSLHKGNITMQYCDVGHFIPAFDFSNNCTTVMSRDTDCSLRETRRVCFKSCKDAGYISNFPAKETAASSVTCSEPSLPDNTHNSNYNAAGYAVGVEVTIQCNQTQDSRTFTCLSTGQWSTEINFCGDDSGSGNASCPDGFDVVNSNCYLAVGLTKTGAEARTYCEDTQNAYVYWPDSFDEYINYTLPYRNGQGWKEYTIWVGMYPDYTEDRWYLDYNDSLFIGAEFWKNNNQYGLTTNNNNYMPWIIKGTATNKPDKFGKSLDNNKKSRSICKKRMSGTGSGTVYVCADRKANCGSTLAINPHLSTLDYGTLFCRKTTGTCGASTCTVPTPQTGVTVGSTTMATGQAVTYTCDSGYSETGAGNHVRACKEDGTLTGTELECVVDEQATIQLVYYDMQNDVWASLKNEITTGPSLYLTVQRNSSVKACRAYCRHAGTLKIQFWGPGSSPKKFILKSEREVTCVGGGENIWNFNTPIDATEGQFAGVYDLTGDLIPRHSCSSTQTIEAAKFVRFFTVTGSDPAIGEQKQFSLYPACHILMLDCFLVPDTHTGSDPEVKFHN